MTEKTLNETPGKDETIAQHKTETAPDKAQDNKVNEAKETQNTTNPGDRPITENERAQLQEITEYLKIALEKAQKENEENKKEMLRIRADAQNTQRRAEKDVEKAHKYGLFKFAESLLPVIDSLESGLAEDSADERSQAIKAGIELTLKLFLDTLKKFDIEQIAPENGSPFNPDYHQAVSQTDNPDMEPGSIINVFQKGYVLNDRLIRPAMVIVSK